MNGAILAVAIVVLALGGCSTPRVALDQSNHGASLIAQLEISLTEFRRVEASAEAARQQSLREQLEALGQVKKSTNRDARARRSAGDGQTVAIIERLIADANGLADDDTTAAATQKTNEALLAALLQPIPSTTAAMTAAQKKLAEMGAELPRETRYAEFLSFAKAIKDAVDANKKKVAEAEDAAKPK